MATKITKDDLDKVFRSVRGLSDIEVMVGVPSTKADRNDPTTPDVNNAAIGYWMEFGVPEHNVPARPFLVPGVKNAQANTIKRFRQAAAYALAGKEGAMNAAFEAAGIEAASAVRDKIRNGPFHPLAPSTIAARKKSDTSQLAQLYAHGGSVSSDIHEALTGVRPLIDTGKLLQSITYVVRKRRK